MNFIAHASRMQCETILVSALGEDELGQSARAALGNLGLDARFIHSTVLLPTGTASVQLGGNGRTSFRIQRPAAYDTVALSADDLQCLAAWRPGWLYCGTLFAAEPRARKALASLIDALPSARRFYDANLRPDCYTPQLVCELLELSDVVKMNEIELEAIRELWDLPNSGIEAFCREGAVRFGWQAVCVTLGECGCAAFMGGRYEEADGFPVEVADPVGAGDAFAAAFLHGLTQGWQLSDIADFSNRVGAIVASRPGGIPDWSTDEVLSMAGHQSRRSGS